MVVITDLEDDHPAAAAAAGDGSLHPDDGDRALAAAAVGADALHAGTKMVATAGDAGGGGLHPDGGDRALAAAAVGADPLHAGTEMVATAGAAGGGDLQPDDGDRALQLMDLPDALLLQIVVRLPLKDAVATSALSTRWKYLWQSRLTSATPNWHVHLHPAAASATRVLDEMRRTTHYNIERFSLIIEQDLADDQLVQFMEYASQRCVQHLLVSARSPFAPGNMNFTLPHSNPHLVSLILEGIRVSRLFCHDRDPFPSLASIRLDGSLMTRNTFSRLLNLSPVLHTLDIRRCRLGVHTYLEPGLASHCPRLKRVSIAHSVGTSTLRAGTAPLLESFSFHNDFIKDSFTLPESAILNDLYLCFKNRVPRSPTMFDKLSFSLPNHLRGLKVLSICSRTLRFAIARFSFAAGNDKLLDLRMLAELQLLVFGLDCEDLGHAYTFLKLCKCPELKRIFVQIHKDYVDGTADDILEDEPPSDLGNVAVAKVAEVTWTYSEVKLICFLVKAAQVVYVVSEAALPPNVRGVTEAELMLVMNSVDAGKIIITEPGVYGLTAFHAEPYID